MKKITGTQSRSPMQQVYAQKYPETKKFLNADLIITRPTTTNDTAIRRYSRPKRDFLPNISQKQKDQRSFSQPNLPNIDLAKSIYQQSLANQIFLYDKNEMPMQLKRMQKSNIEEEMKKSLQLKTPLKTARDQMTVQKRIEGSAPLKKINAILSPAYFDNLGPRRKVLETTWDVSGGKNIRLRDFNKTRTLTQIPESIKTQSMHIPQMLYSNEIKRRIYRNQPGRRPVTLASSPRAQLQFLEPSKTVEGVQLSQKLMPSLEYLKGKITTPTDSNATEKQVELSAKIERQRSYALSCEISKSTP